MIEVFAAASPSGLEPATILLGGRCGPIRWSFRRDRASSRTFVEPLARRHAASLLAEAAADRSPLDDLAAAVDSRDDGTETEIPEGPKALLAAHVWDAVATRCTDLPAPSGTPATGPGQDRRA